MDHPSAPSDSSSSAARKQSPAVISIPSSSPSTSRVQLASNAIQKKSSSSLTSRRSPRTGEKQQTPEPGDKASIRHERSQEPVGLTKEKETLLASLKGDFGSIFNLVTCKICYDLLFEPFTTSCGHTYCYPCLCKSFHGVSGKQCPECRTRLLNAPAPAYLVRELSHIILARPELLPPSDGIEHFKKAKAEQEKALSDDKSGPGIFKGYFRNRAPRPLRDPIDGVDRCPWCHWELEGGNCPQCGLPFDENGTGSWSEDGLSYGEMHTEEDDFGFDELDHDLAEDEEYDGPDFMDDEDLDYGALPFGYNEYDIEGELGLGNPYVSSISGSYASTAPRRGASHSAAAGVRRRSYAGSTMSIADTEMDILEEEEEDEDEDSSMSGFIDDRSIGGMTRDGQSATPGAEQTDASSSAASTSAVEDDEEDAGPVPNNRRRRRADSNTPTPGNAHPTQRRRLVEQPSPNPSWAATVSSTHPVEEHRPTTPPARRRTYVIPSSSTSPEVPSQAGPSNTTPSVRDATWGYTQLNRDSQDEAMEGDDESDTQTTVGDPAPIVTTAASRPEASAPQSNNRPRPGVVSPTRSATTPATRFNRGLRRRGSVVSNSTTHYEDNDADDDGSGRDPDGDINMSRTIRPQRSRILRGPRRANTVPNPTNQLNFVEVNPEFDSEESTDLSGPSPRRSRGSSQRDYDPRISQFFADHQEDLQQVPRTAREVREFSTETFEQLRMINRTPHGIQRPRTSNRNRTTPSPMNHSPALFSPPTQRPVPNGQPQRLRSLLTPAQEATILAASTNGFRPGLDRSPSNNGQRRHASTTPDDVNTDPRRSQVHDSPPSPPSIRNRTLIARSLDAHLANSPNLYGSDSASRPDSRFGNRPPSANSRRNLGFAPPGTYDSMVLSYGANPSTSGPWPDTNPFRLRPRQSAVRLREQSSNATLRGQPSNRTLRGHPSRGSIRSNNASLQDMPVARTPVSQLRSQPSNRALHQHQLNHIRNIIQEQSLRHTASRLVLPPSGGGSFDHPAFEEPIRPPNPMANRGRNISNNGNPPLQSLSHSSSTPSTRPSQPNPSTAVPTDRISSYIQGLSSSTATTAPSQPARAPTFSPTSSATSSITGAGLGSARTLQSPSPHLARRRSNRGLAGSSALGFTGTGAGYGRQVPSPGLNRNYTAPVGQIGLAGEGSASGRAQGRYWRRDSGPVG